jgi:hypothetical protein
MYIYIFIHISCVYKYTYIYMYMYTHMHPHIYIYTCIIYIYIILNNVQVSFETWELDKKNPDCVNGNDMEQQDPWLHVIAAGSHLQNLFRGGVHTEWRCCSP